MKAYSYSQWAAGDDNVIADNLSRDHHLSTPRLTQLLLHSATHQMPPNFSILPTPSDIVSRLTSWTQIGRAPKDFTLTPKRSSIASFASGSNFSHPFLDSVTFLTHSWWSTCPPNNVHEDSLEPSLMRSGKPSSARIETLLWHQQQSVTPSHLYRLRTFCGTWQTRPRYERTWQNSPHSTPPVLRVQKYRSSRETPMRIDGRIYLKNLLSTKYSGWYMHWSPLFLRYQYFRASPPHRPNTKANCSWKYQSRHLVEKCFINSRIFHIFSHRIDHILE